MLKENAWFLPFLTHHHAKTLKLSPISFTSICLNDIWEKGRRARDSNLYMRFGLEMCINLDCEVLFIQKFTSSMVELKDVCFLLCPLAGVKVERRRIYCQGTWRAFRFLWCLAAHARSHSGRQGESDVCVLRQGFCAESKGYGGRISEHLHTVRQGIIGVDDAMATDLENLTITPSGNTVEKGEKPMVPRVDWAKYSKRVLIKNILGRPDGGVGLVGERVVVGGWVKTGREQGKNTFAFLEVNDGSCPGNIQVLVDASVGSLSQLTPTGTCVLVEGELKQPPEGAKQKVELKVEKILQVGSVDPAKYPIAKTRLPLDFLRNYVHLRPRTNTIASVARIRNALAYATHTFFQNHGFLYVNTPIITTSDCEGAGEMFQVTTLFSEADRIEEELKAMTQPTEADLEAAKAAVKEKGEKVRDLKSGNNDKSTIDAAVAELQKAKEQLAKMEERFKLKPGIPQKDGRFDYSRDFFSRQAYLTVSGQLQVESYACALSSVYTFGPTFRAEHSHTTRHLAEFWMVEPEMAFADIEDDMNCAEDYVKFLCQWLLNNCSDDMKFMSNMFDKTAMDRLRLVASTSFARITYTEAVELLQKVTDKKFDNKVEWGIDLASEHERYLTEEIFKKPVIVYNYPKEIKSFYMRINDDGKTVAAMDLLVPKVGELIGGSQREERYEVLEKRIQEAGLPREPYEWYLDLRRYGTVKHSGFGLGFERMVLFATGLENIRDVIPFPRYPGRADL